MTKSERTSKVRVGVRVRPLASKEIQQGGKLSLSVSAPSISIGQNKKFTYDAVFDSKTDQEDMYDHVSGSLLETFIDGYNATILAYGQTGSGKTYTMGSEAHTQPEGSSQNGLIPRFISDFFEEMKKRKISSDSGAKDAPVLLDYSMKASFLEVYGEDVYDLLDSERKSLPLREDSAGGVVIAGLTSRDIASPGEALQVLHEGTNNRTTAATLMNLTSSRSHAVFTIHLTQTTRSDGHDMDIVTNSKFTFVDLAGSERMKKTGAEGERAREGIKINEGLLALGNVINALADEERALKEKKIHVPYRQSKLTRLLQDALGGNSQTLFLACVSPSDTNASETLSTLHYANRARRIRNAPTKNVDATSAELQRLHCLTKVLQSELVKSRFQIGGIDKENIGNVDEELMKRSDVDEYLQLISRTANTMSGAGDIPDHKLLPMPPSAASFGPLVPIQETNSSRTSKGLIMDQTPSKGVSERFGDSVLLDVNPDEDMAILDHLLELQHHDHEYDKVKKEDDEQMQRVDGELERGEALLLQLRESLKAYQSLKKMYEELMAEVQQLEAEKESLAGQLEKAKADPSTGCSVSIKKQLERVEQSLARARRETQTHRQKYRAAEDQAKRCRILERKISELKAAKRGLVKKQKEAATKYKEASEAKTKELFALRRKEKAAQNRMSKMKTEIQHQKVNLEKRKNYCAKLSDKLKQTEKHLTKLLSMRKRNLLERTGNGDVASSNFEKKGTSHEGNKHNISNEDMKAMQYIFDKMVPEKVDQGYAQLEYKEKVTAYGETMRLVVSKVKEMNELKKDVDSDSREIQTLEETKQHIAELELKLELLETDLREAELQLPDESTSTRNEEAAKKLMNKLPSSALRKMLFDSFSKLVQTETQKKLAKDTIARKDAALSSFESEVELLNGKVRSLTRDLADRRFLSDSGENVFELLKAVTQERDELKLELESITADYESMKLELKDSKRVVADIEISLSKAKEDLVLAEASLSASGGTNESKRTLDEIQDIWETLGVNSSVRDRTREAIKCCLSDTCVRELDEARRLKQQTEDQIEHLQTEIRNMQDALGLDNSAEVEANGLIQQEEKLQERATALSTPFKFSLARRDRIISDAFRLSSNLGLTKDQLPMNLQAIMTQVEEKDQQKLSKEGENSMLTVAKLQSLPPRSLESSFLLGCENELAELRLKKSEILLRNRENLQEITVLVKGMHSTVPTLVSLIELYLQEIGSGRPSWWDTMKAEEVLQSAAASCPERNTESFETEHIECIVSALASIAEYRQALSRTLRQIVENAQEKLLDIVGREIDASEAYTSFRDALLKLPALSKDFSDACLSEMEALVLGVETMTQSEIEALTVVWEALKVSSRDRRSFWGKIDDQTILKQSSQDDPFDELQSKTNTVAEEWVEEAIQRGRSVFHELGTKLAKLDAIHQQVESLRSRQDIKSQILSLDSEIRILNSKLLDFEELQCSKQRLLTKKSGSNALLKEERFRKQMKSKFVANLGQLASLLRTWTEKEGQPFDSSLLSDDVRMLLKHPDKMDTWIEKRTKLMPTRTVMSASKNTNAKRPIHQRHASGLTPPRKRATTANRGIHQPPKQTVKRPPLHSKDERSSKVKRQAPFVADENVRNGESPVVNNGSPKVQSRKTRRKEAATLPPFGRILSEMASPKPNGKR